MTDQLIAPPGLKHLVVADTTVGGVRGNEGFYHYRQYNAVELARTRGFEAIVGLLLDGQLPDPASELSIRTELAAHRLLDGPTLDLLKTLASHNVSPLAGLRAAISILVDDTPVIDLTHTERRARTLKVIAAVPAVVGVLYRYSSDATPLAADPGLGHAADYVRMVTGTVPRPELIRAVEIYLCLTADHGFNASTFATRVITSTGASVSSALAGAVGALSGPLHGGAPSRVLDMLADIGDVSNTEKWAMRELEAGRPIMGFGHAVYRAEDPRSVLLKELALTIGGPTVVKAVAVEERLSTLLADWKPGATLVTNVEYYAAIVLHLAELPAELFTSTFATARVLGWSAHLLEQAGSNKIMRPSARYVGPLPAQDS